MKTMKPVIVFVAALCWDGAVGLPLASIVGRVWKMELGLPPLCQLVRSGRLATLDGLHASRSRAVRRTSGQPGCAHARKRGVRTQKTAAEPALRLQPGRLPHPDP